MLWVVTKNESMQITRCNTFEKDGKFQVWVERQNGKNMKIHESESEDNVNEIKDMIDFAIENQVPSIDLKKFV